MPPSTKSRTIAVAVATPTPTPRFAISAQNHSEPTGGRHAVIAIQAGSPPSKLAITTDPNECDKHTDLGGKIACSAAIPSGMVALLWNYPACKDCITGFRVYRVDGSRRDRLIEQAHGTDVTLAIVDKPAAGACYAVTAFGAKGETSDSDRACVGDAQISKTMLLDPTHVRSSKKYNGKGSEFMRNSSFDKLVPSDIVNQPVISGYEYYNDVNPLGDSSANAISRAAVVFDLVTVQKSIHRLAHATLILSVGSTVFGKNQIDHSTSCATKIATATERWWNNSDWINANGNGVDVGERNGTDVALDVTPIVQNWLSPAGQHLGFVLIGKSEDLYAFLAVSSTGRTERVWSGLV